MIRKLLILLLLSGLTCLPAARQPIHPFFQNIHLDSPVLSQQLEFQLSSGNHATAFLMLTHWLSQNISFSDFAQHLAPHLKQIIGNLSELSVGDFDLAPLLDEQPTNLDLFVSLGQIMTSRYDRNRLSGPWAEKFWQRIYALIESTMSQKRPGKDQAALLYLAQKMTFFKKAGKWGKKSRKILNRKLKTDHPNPSPLSVSILNR